MLIILICAFITLLGQAATSHPHNIFPDFYWITGLIVITTTLVLYISLDWYFWCVIKKVYNDTKNNQDMLLTEIEHGEIELQII